MAIPTSQKNRRRVEPQIYTPEERNSSTENMTKVSLYLQLKEACLTSQKMPVCHCSLSNVLAALINGSMDSEVEVGLTVASYEGRLRL